MRMPLVALFATLLFTLTAGCAEEASQARIEVLFTGHNPVGIPDISSVVKFDADERPSLAAYVNRSMAHPDFYTVHDFLIDWNDGYRLQFSFYDGLGYSVDAILGVRSEFVTDCWFWATHLNGVAMETGISTTAVASGDVVTFVYTDCSTGS